jgi:hypothetical protein
MPSRQVRPVDTASIIRGLDARLRKLETYPPSGMQLLDRVSFNSASGLGASATYLPTTPGYSDPFVLIRPQPILVFGVLGAANMLQGGGTCPGGSVVLSIVPSAGGQPDPELDINGTPMQSAQSLLWCGNPPDGSNTFSMMCFVMPPGSYRARFHYLMLPPITSCTFGFNDGEIDVFAISG